MEADHTELLDRIVAEGDRRKRRRRLAAGGGAGLAAVVLLAGVALAGAGDDQQVAAGDDPTSTTEARETTTTAAPTTSSTATTAIEATTTTTTAAPVVGGEEPPPAEETSPPPPVCRNSHDERCGAFYWDYDPASFPNAPLHLTITPPQTIIAGQPAPFEFTFVDGDSLGRAGCSFVSFGGASQVVDGDRISPSSGYAWACPATMCAADTRPRFGPWDPPGPLTAEPDRATLTATFPEPGTFTVALTARSEATCLGASTSGPGFTGYDSRAEISISVEVLPA